MIEVKKTCAKCKHLLKGDLFIAENLLDYSCEKLGWNAIEHLEDLDEPVDCGFYEEATDEQRD